MHCPECESFSDIEFAETDLFLQFPLAHSHSKVASMLGGSDIEYDILDNDGVKVMLGAGQMRSFMIKLQGRLTGEELAASHGLTLPKGRELTTSDLIRVMPLSQLIGRSQGQWLRQLIEESR